MKCRRMRLFALLAAALMLLCGAQAIAEKMTPVPAERIRNVTLPEGVVLIGDPVIAKGKVTVYVDDDKTNWTEVLLKAASRNIIDATLTVDAPFADAAKGVRENFGNGDNETLPAIAEGVVPTWFPQECPLGQLSENSLKSSVVFAEVTIGQTTYIQPIPAVTAGTLFAWADSSGKVQYEYVQWDQSQQSRAGGAIPCTDAFDDHGHAFLRSRGAPCRGHGGNRDGRNHLHSAGFLRPAWQSAHRHSCAERSKNRGGLFFHRSAEGPRGRQRWYRASAHHPGLPSGILTR